MNTPQKSALVLGLVLLAGFGIFEITIVRQQRAELARLNAKLAASRAVQPPTTAGAAVVPAPATPKEPPTQKTDSTDSASPLDQRVALLKQLLRELPAQNLPEIKLLTAADWLDIARKHTLESSADIRVALADLRAIARKKFADALQNALRDYTTAWSGQLPDDIAQLAPRLTAPADAEMLARYEMIRTGKLGDPSEKLIREKKTSDMILSVGLEDWSLNNNSDAPPAFGETEDAALERTWRALSTALGDDAKADMDAMASPSSIVNLMKDTMQNVAPIYGDANAMGDALKQAVKSFQAAHPDESLSNVGQILPYLSQADKFAETLRPTLAQLAYLKDHGGQPPADAAALQVYLNRPFNPAEALQDLKLSSDGNQVSMSFNWEIKK